MKLEVENENETRIRRRRLLFETKISLGADFLEEIHDININMKQSDKWVWINDTIGKYTDRRAY